MTIAIVGAGPGLGAAVARKFGREGFAVALIARNRTKLEALEKDLAADGVTARGYVADVRDRDPLARGFRSGSRTAPLCARKDMRQVRSSYVFHCQKKQNPFE